MLMIACVLMLLCAMLLSARTRVMLLLHGDGKPESVESEKNPFLQDKHLYDELVQMGVEDKIRRMRLWASMASVFLYSGLIIAVLIPLLIAEGIEPSTALVVRFAMLGVSCGVLVRSIYRHRRVRHATLHLRRKPLLVCFAEEALAAAKALPEPQARSN
jgi:hypothetical protein